MEDNGIADIFVHGNGMSLDIVVAPQLTNILPSVAPPEGKHPSAVGERSYNLPVEPVQTEVVEMIKTESQKPGRAFIVERVECRIHDLSLRIIDTKHDWLYSILMPYIKSKVRNSIEKSIEQNVSQLLFNLDEKVMESVNPTSVEERHRILPEWASTAYDPMS
ncbi:hypothetical protein O9G_001518 [Rozella allomycis CSF55]|uniref:HAM1-like C-terminal domain-containing protein n=1 Tax=Rozella allomycis (strain CSF55) TaxID=988480 RepID=A0A075B4Q2_ROZAC|nr:hypothetical protein O9G_001518 [Rozella allomycis CSF55]|eukprot:EPZ36534.1 hypothetical protein O9G_001518 [Rozella allomycis CSF55]